MPTYADLYNEQLRAQGRSLPSNPVRLTISKGDYVWDPTTSRFRYEEQWEEEHLMEFEDLDDLQHRAPIQQPVIDSRPNHDPLKNNFGLREALRHENIGSLEPLLHRNAAHQSLWVLDTNTLMSCLDLLKALFASLLTQSVASAAASDTEVRPSAMIRLIIPYIVISELDGLKTTRRKDDNGRSVAAMAKEANNWILTALQKQKRVPIDSNGSNLPQELHPLFVEPSKHYNRNKSSNTNTFDHEQTNDEQIINFCSQLKQAAGSDSASTGVWFCSDDINARTRAEMDGIDSLGVRELARALQSQLGALHSTEQRMQQLADALIEQWQYQVGVETDVSPLQTPKSVYGPLSIPANGEHGATPRMPSPAPPPTVREVVPDRFSPPTLSGAHLMDEAMQEEDLSQMVSPVVLLHGGTTAKTTALSAPSRTSINRQNNLSASPGGRSTEHSIHAPAHRRASPQITQGGFSGHTSAAKTGYTEGIDTPTAEELNPQISWDELVRQTQARGRHESHRIAPNYQHL